MSKFLGNLLPVIIIIIFISIMQGFYPTASKEQNKDFKMLINCIENDVNDERWSSARDNFTSLNSLWKQVIPRIQFHAEREAINDINVNLARLNSFLKIKDQSGALAELGEAEEHWINLHK